MLVGHPFNPPHLIPLVEVVRGRRPVDAGRRAGDGVLHRGRQAADPAAPGAARPRREPAAGRALAGGLLTWSSEGVASVADIDTAISQGPGLRWAVLGPFANQHLSGGPGGLAHVLEHLGPPTEAWWRDLRSVTLTPELVATLVAGVDDELAGVDPAELVERRDAVLHALLAAKAGVDLP